MEDVRKYEDKYFGSMSRICLKKDDEIKELYEALIDLQGNKKDGLIFEDI